MMRNTDIVEVPPQTPVDWKVNGLIPTGEMTFNQWVACGEFIKNIDRSVHFWIGDWLLMGEGKWDDVYEKAQEATGLDLKTLRNTKWVANSIAMSRRRDTLSFSHHEVVASCSPEQQDLLLEQAETQGWSVKRLREEKQMLLASIVQPAVQPPQRPEWEQGPIKAEPKPATRTSPQPRKPDPVAQPYKLIEVAEPDPPSAKQERHHAPVTQPKPEARTAVVETIDVEYWRTLGEFGARFNDAFTLAELDTACQKIMRASGGFAAMRRLLNGERALIREFVLALGAVLSEEGAA